MPSLEPADHFQDSANGRIRSVCRVGLGEEAVEGLNLPRPYDLRDRLDQLPGLPDHILGRPTRGLGLSLPLSCLSIICNSPADRGTDPAPSEEFRGEGATDACKELAMNLVRRRPSGSRTARKRHQQLLGMSPELLECSTMRTERVSHGATPGLPRLEPDRLQATIEEVLDCVASSPARLT